MNNSLAIKGAGILLGNGSVKNTDILIEDGVISRIGKIGKRADKIIDGKHEGLIAIPGLINTHAHIAMAPLKGMVDGTDLMDFLKTTSDFDARNSKSMVYDSAIVGMAEMIRNGITDFVDFYYSEDVVAKAVDDLNYQGNLAWVVLDKDKTTQDGDPISNAENFIKHNKVKSVKPMVAIQGVYAASKETMEAAYEIAKKHGTKVTMHIAETEYEVKEHKKKHGLRPVEWMHKNGFVNKNLLAVHCVWLDKNEIAMISNAGAVSYNPTSNMKLGSGIAPITEMMDSGASITLGTDSVASNNSLDIISEMKYGSLLQAVRLGNPKAILPKQAFSFATYNAAQFLHHGKSYGLKEGAKADITLIKNGIGAGRSNAINALVYSSSPANIVGTIVNGKVLYYKGFAPKILEKVTTSLKRLEKRERSS
ncbi:MAG: amidohydrolase family protein [Candidatus Marsarchaeota archaeon]|jgi:5-methylthioadenosine/S-adenosylhomocysteine deaminase|nr:amidohydrolase family protein [Candidatus Marsarchaeota archaeon]